MATFDYAQLEQLWIQAGGPKPLAPVMAAIAMAESGGNSQARNPSGASGLWQILGNPFPGDPFDPATNAKMAVAKYHSQGLGAWVTYTSGAYKQFLKGNVPPATGGGGVQTTSAPGGLAGAGLSVAPLLVPGFAIPLDIFSGSVQGISDVGVGVESLAQTFSNFVTLVSWLFVPNHWIRIIAFVGGVSFVGTGLLVMTIGARPIPVSAGPVGTQISTGSIAPALGIAEVTFGSVLLFIAFHNLPDNVQNFPQLLSYMQSKISTGAASKEGPGPKPKAPVI